MVLDKEEHRAMLIELIDKAHFPGAARKFVMELAQAIESADVAKAEAQAGPAITPFNLIKEPSHG